MKKQLSPKVTIAIIAVIVIILGIVGFTAMKPAADKDFIPANPQNMPAGMPGAPPMTPPAGPTK